MSIPPERIRPRNDAPIRDGAYVLYWMVSARRPRWNYALQRACAEAARLRRPLVILEALRCDHPWASARFHRFILDGMVDNAAWFTARSGWTRPVTYHPYIEPSPGAGRGLLAALAADACLVVTDDPYGNFTSRMVAAAAAGLPVRVESIDGNGVYPVLEAPRAFPTARGWRGHLHRNLADYLLERPEADPLDGLDLPRRALPEAVLRRWPAADAGAPIGALPIDHSVGPVGEAGGFRAASTRMERFLGAGLPAYGDRRNDPTNPAASGLSPYLHFGHLSAHELLARVLDGEGWTPARVDAGKKGKREGWWGLSPAAEGFVEQLTTWRELGFNGCAFIEGWDRYDSLPDWAKKTLGEHAGDERKVRYDRDTLAAARTHDPIWNAAQRQLAREGRIHNYLRMLWGKKILEWTSSPREALDVLVDLNNTYALDGRDPNSYSGIFWVLGRYDRAWGPERPIFGKIRYMSSESTRRKLKLKGYLARYGSESEHA